jgi:peptide/nickel transport system permease protein
MDFLRRFAQDRVGLAFSFVLLALAVVALTAQWIAPYDPFAISLRQGMRPPSWTNWLGTDQFGRDVFSRVLLATQVTSKIAISSILFAVLIGVPVGMFVGYRGGMVEAIVMRITDVLLIFPIILLAIVIVVIAGPSERGVVIALGLSQMPQFIRITRGITLSIKEELYVEAAIAAGASTPSILLRHIWPNISAPIVVQATLTLPVFVLNTAALSYLGLGVQPPNPEWGQMLNEAKEVLASAPYLIIGPSVALFLSVLSANLVGDALQETLNPKLKGRRLKRPPVFGPALLPGARKAEP